MAAAQIRMKHQNNPALMPRRKRFQPAPKPKIYAPRWNGLGYPPPGARKDGSNNRTVPQTGDGNEVPTANTWLSGYFSQGSTPASWYGTDVGDNDDYQQQQQQQQHTPAAATTDASHAKDMALSYKRQGKQPVVDPPAAQDLRPQPDHKLVDNDASQNYPVITSDVQHGNTPTRPKTPESDYQWAIREADKVYNRQARDDPDWSDTSSDEDVIYISSSQKRPSPGGREGSEEGEILDTPTEPIAQTTNNVNSRKRRSPAPEVETPRAQQPLHLRPLTKPAKRTKRIVTTSSSSTSSARTSEKEKQRSHTRRYSTLKEGTASIQKRLDLISAISKNWNQEIRLAIPYDLGPRRQVDGQDIPADVQDWSVPFLTAAWRFSEKTEGEPERAQKALRRAVRDLVAGSAGRRKWDWVAYVEDFEAAERELDSDNHDGNGVGIEGMGEGGGDGWWSYV